MSAFGQTGGPEADRSRARRGIFHLELVLYGLNEAGEPAFAERLQPHQREGLRELASDRLSRCHAVEVWEGPTCVLRLRRSAHAV